MKFSGPTALARHLIGAGASDDDIMTAYRDAFGPGSERPLKFTRHDLKRLRKRIAERGSPTEKARAIGQQEIEKQPSEGAATRRHSRGAAGNAGTDPKVETPRSVQSMFPDLAQRPSLPFTGQPFTGTPTALGVYIFAGGFTLGVKRAGFNVLAQLEDGPYGVATTRHNHPNLVVHTDPGTWPLTDFRDVHFVYGNPPCAPFSNAGISSKKIGQMSDWWKRDPRASCITRMFAVLEACHPVVWAWESVQPAYRRGRELVDELTTVATGLGYAASYVMMNAVHLGVPQKRRRFFCVFHRIRISWDLGYSRYREPATVGQAWDVIHDNDTSPPPPPLAKHELAVLGDVPQGGSLRRAWERAHPPETWEKTERGTVKGRPSFLRTRLNFNAPSPTLTGSATKIHPTEDRYITVKEAQLLCGYPLDYEIVGPTNQCYAQIAQAVMPPVGEWLARCVRSALKRGESIVAGTRTLVDLETGAREVIV